MKTRRQSGWTWIAIGWLVLAGHTVASNASKKATQAPAPYSYIHHVVSTDIPAAQFAFDRGLTLVFAYDPGEAEQAFREAARLDPSLAMAWWGIALAVGPNINIQPDAKSNTTAAEAIARAHLLAEARATDLEREYISALSARYEKGQKQDFDRLAKGYREAMKTLAMKHPDDPDAAALYAEAIMDLRPWRLWTAQGDPAPDTPELVSVLEHGLARFPAHLGLLHYYIHAVEASNDPGKALSAARRLAALPMEPAAAHLVHMPAHIYLRVGDWEAAVQANEHAVHHALDYRLSNNPTQQRACGHCVDFLTYAYMMEGNEAHARQSASDYQQLSNDPSNSIAVLVRFHEWEDLLAFPEPAVDSKAGYRDTHVVRGLWHFGRGLAFAANSRLDRARTELEGLQKESALAPTESPFGTALEVEHAIDKVTQTDDAVALKIAAALLGARIAESSGSMSESVRLLREAVVLQDGMPYNEPPAWFYPVRESLGAMLLKNGSAAEAESVLREGLQVSPHNGRLLLGLSEAVRAQGRAAEAARIHAEFETAWHDSDRNITASDL